MKCSKARKLILLYAGGDLSAKKALRLEAHLHLCSECRQQTEELENLLKNLKTAYEAEKNLLPEIDGETIIRLRQRILDLQEQKKERFPLRPAFSKRFAPVAAFIGGFIFLALVLVFWLLPEVRTKFIFSQKEERARLKSHSVLRPSNLEQPRYEIFLTTESGIKIYWIIEKNFSF